MREMEAVFSFEGLKVYQVARQLVRNIYLLQNAFPKEERYALGDQVRRAATISKRNNWICYVLSLKRLQKCCQGFAIL